ncbi:MAG: hypothetical protein CSB55_06775 [Candidatus Cloacimonadota bacterium]|nr:MAG: hypothetical protein CSB55_06775 [Candidatus Cloacimonadota bacterium]
MKVKGIGPLTYKKLSDCFLKFGEEDYEIKASVNYRKSVEKLNIKININTAGADELTLLEGIGLEKAKRIEEFRKTSGKFTAKEDIMKVKGIGKRTYEKIKDKIILKD